MISVSSVVALGFLLGMRHATDADHVVAVATIVSRERTMGGADRRRLGPRPHGDHRSGRRTHHPVQLGSPTPNRAQALHGHAHEDAAIGWLDQAAGSGTLYSLVRPLLVGVVHGLAGSAAVAFLVLATIRDPVWAVAYLVVFGIGTVAGMMLITTLVALSFNSVAEGVGARCSSFVDHSAAYQVDCLSGARGK
jgi:hypothetical protein